jgi:hypothetical protein
MAAELPRTAIAAPSFPAFVVAYASWATALVMWMVIPVATGTSQGTKKAFLCFALTPFLLLVGSHWVGKSPDLLTLLRRSITAHALSLMLPGALMGIAQSSDPGASGHGGLFLFFIILIPCCLIAALLPGLAGAFTAFGLMRFLRSRGGGTHH